MHVIPFRTTHVSANDGRWHHICASWENKWGSWKLYKDGFVASSGIWFQAGRVIRSGGSLTLAQDQDSLGGSFKKTSRLHWDADKRQCLELRAVHSTY